MGLKISSSHKSPSYLEFKKDRKELKDLKDELRSLKQEIYDSSFEKERIFLQSLWRYEGASQRTVSIAQYLLFCRNNPIPEVQLTYISCLLENNEQELALVGLKDYINKHGTYKIHDFLPVAHLANNNGFSNELISQAHYLFDHLENNRKNNKFDFFLRNKTIAVVGNSPEVLANNYGAEIDSHEVVMRMSMFKISQIHKVNTGEKINIFVSNANKDVIFSNNYNQENLAKYKWLYLAMDFWHIQLSDFLFENVPFFLSKHCDIIRNSDTKLCYFYPKFSSDIRQRAKIAVATTGLKILYHLTEEGIPFDEYGFNSEIKEGIYPNDLKEELDSPSDNFDEALVTSAYYRNLNFWGTGHNLNQELRFRRSLKSRSRLS